MQAGASRLCRFAVIADIQHANKVNSYSTDYFVWDCSSSLVQSSWGCGIFYSGRSVQADGDRDNSHQYYKSAATKLGKAVKHINAEKDSLEFVLNLGDIIDGNASLEATVQDLEVVAAEFDKCVCSNFEALHASLVMRHHEGSAMQHMYRVQNRICCAGPFQPLH